MEQSQMDYNIINKNGEIQCITQKQLAVFQVLAPTIA